MIPLVAEVLTWEADEGLCSRVRSNASLEELLVRLQGLGLDAHVRAIEAHRDPLRPNGGCGFTILWSRTLRSAELLKVLEKL